MNRSATIFLQIVLVLVGIGVLVFLLRAPLRGANPQATLVQIYSDPFVMYAYLGFVPFFVGLYHAFKLLGYIGRNDIFSPRAVRAVRAIKVCALVMLGFVAVSVVFMIHGDPEDRPPGLFLRLLFGLPCLVVATTAAVCERILRKAVELKSENDLTV